MNGYVTLLSSEDYFPAVLILQKNLQELNSQYPLVVLVTNDVYLKVYKELHKYNISYSIVPRLEYTDQTKQNWEKISSTVLNTASKLNIFKMKDMEKVIYVDADSFFLKNPDELFNYPDGAMYDDQEGEAGFSGLFVCNPVNHSYDYYYHIMRNFVCLDGDLLGTLWFPFKTNDDYKIPHNWFINIVTLGDTYKLSEINGIHFCNKFKPWKYDNVDEYINDIQKEFPQTGDIRKTIIEKYINKYVIPVKQLLDNQ